MGKKKKKKTNYDPKNTLRLSSLSEETEKFASSLYELACCGSRRFWDEMTDLKAFQGNKKLKRRFIESCHKGMREAQDIIIERILSDEEMNPSYEIIYRGIANSIGWQLISNQICYARRFYKGHKPQDLKHSNFQSAVDCARQIIEEKSGNMVLISDLTTFIQVGDLLSVGIGDGIKIIEVKEGKKNQKISDILHSIDSTCMKETVLSIEKEGPSFEKQFFRVVRQLSRMGHVVECLKKGHSIDPDTDTTVIIKEEFEIGDWYKEFNQVLDESDKKEWAIKIIDNCIFIGAYSGHMWRAGGHVAFNRWFDDSGGTPNCPRFSLIDSMLIPLALPIFNLNIPSKYKFDILYGRKNICIGINIPHLLMCLEEKGLKIRCATNKEATKFNQMGIRPYRLNNKKVIMVGNDKIEIPILDGIFIRSIFHFQRPINLIRSLLNTEIEKQNTN